MARRLAPIALALAASSLAGGVRADPAWYVSGAFGGYFRQDDTAATTFTRTGYAYPPPVPPPATGPLASGGSTVIVTGTPHPPPLGPVLETFHAAGVATHAHQPGEAANLALGRRLGSRLRVEVELGYTTYAAGDLRPFTADPNFPTLDGRAFKLGAGGQFQRETASLNGFYDFRFRDAPGGVLASAMWGPLKDAQWAPYLGLGLGGAATRVSNAYYADAAGDRFHSLGGAGGSGLALAEAGLNLRLAPDLTLSPAYRYVRYFNANADIAHELKASLRYRF